MKKISLDSFFNKHSDFLPFKVTWRKFGHPALSSATLL